MFFDKISLHITAIIIKPPLPNFCGWLAVFSCTSVVLTIEGKEEASGFYCGLQRANFDKSVIVSTI